MGLLPLFYTIHYYNLLDWKRFQKIGHANLMFMSPGLCFTREFKLIVCIEVYELKVLWIKWKLSTGNSTLKCQDEFCNLIIIKNKGKILKECFSIQQLCIEIENLSGIESETIYTKMRNQWLLVKILSSFITQKNYTRSDFRHQLPTSEIHPH